MEVKSAVRAQQASVELLRRHDEIGSHVGTLVAGAPARCAALDAAAIESVLAGWAHRRTEPTVHGDLIATRTGIFYVVPQAAYVWFRPWPLAHLSVGKTSKLTRRSELVVSADGEHFVFQVPSRAVDGLMRAAADYPETHTP